MAGTSRKNNQTQKHAQRSAQMSTERQRQKLQTSPPTDDRKPTDECCCCRRRCCCRQRCCRCCCCCYCCFCCCCCATFGFGAELLSIAIGVASLLMILQLLILLLQLPFFLGHGEKLSNDSALFSRLKFIFTSDARRILKVKKKNIFLIN